MLVPRYAKQHVHREIVRRSDRGVTAMKFGRAVLLGCVVVGMTTAAAAFQEQQGSGGAPAQPAAPQAVQKPAMEFSVPDVGKGAAGGTEVRIPGLGKLGVLPKMDFGLELLYGAADGKVPDARPDQADDDGLRVHGTVKHRF